MSSSGQGEGLSVTKVASFIIVVGAVLFMIISNLPALLRHSGPRQLLMLGHVRFSSCEYKGEFIGGIGFDCVARNYAGESRAPDMTCANYDDHERLIGQPSSISALSRTRMSEGEERVIRLYGASNAETIVCTEIGELPVAPIRHEFSELEKDGMASELAL